MGCFFEWRSNRDRKYLVLEPHHLAQRTDSNADPKQDENQ